MTEEHVARLAHDLELDARQLAILEGVSPAAVALVAVGNDADELAELVIEQQRELLKVVRQLNADDQPVAGARVAGVIATMSKRYAELLPDWQRDLSMIRVRAHYWHAASVRNILVGNELLGVSRKLAAAIDRAAKDLASARATVLRNLTLGHSKSIAGDYGPAIQPLFEAVEGEGSEELTADEELVALGAIASCAGRVQDPDLVRSMSLRIRKVLSTGDLQSPNSAVIALLGIAAGYGFLEGRLDERATTNYQTASDNALAEMDEWWPRSISSGTANSVLVVQRAYVEIEVAAERRDFAECARLAADLAATVEKLGLPRYQQEIPPLREHFERLSSKRAGVLSR